MIEFIINTIINKPPNVVSQAFLEPKNIIHWMTNLERFKELVETCGFDFSKSPKKGN